jgi:hypothetical protein
MLPFDEGGLLTSVINLIRFNDSHTSALLCVLLKFVTWAAEYRRGPRASEGVVVSVRKLVAEERGEPSGRAACASCVVIEGVPSRGGIEAAGGVGYQGSKAGGGIIVARRVDG